MIDASEINSALMFPLVSLSLMISFFAAIQASPAYLDGKFLWQGYLVRPLKIVMALFSVINGWICVELLQLPLGLSATPLVLTMAFYHYKYTRPEMISQFHQLAIADFFYELALKDGDDVLSEFKKIFEHNLDLKKATVPPEERDFTFEEVRSHYNKARIKNGFSERTVEDLELPNHLSRYRPKGNELSA